MPTNLSEITRPEVQDFIRSHEGADEKELVLSRKEILGLPSAEIVQQILGRRKTRKKLPSWYKTSGVVYPPTINLEQCSSEATACYKQSLVGELTPVPSVVADVTGGFGVDSFFLSKSISDVHYVEPDATLFEIARHNHRQLGVTILHHNTSAEQFLNQMPENVDLLYLDPSRRDVHAKRVFKLSDCTPDVTTLQKKIFEKCHWVLIKTSPLLDLQQGLREIRSVRYVHVVAVDNECKELLFLADRDFIGTPEIRAVDLYADGSIRSAFTFTPEDERMAPVSIREPARYLYEPNAAILKAGAFKLVGETFALTKLAPNTHLYTSDHLLPNFPGRTFEIITLDPDSKRMQHLSRTSINILTRNYPLRPEAIKKKYQLQDGGDHYLIGFSSARKKHLALCIRLQV
jgi:16S rRNA G966 N2-methylase RsmD